MRDEAVYRKVYVKRVYIYPHRFQSVLPNQPMPYTSTFHGLYTVAREEGIYKGLYKGVINVLKMKTFH